MLTEDFAEIYQPPALLEPSAAEHQALQALTGRVRLALGALPVAADFAPPSLPPQPLESAEWALAAAWTAGPRWQLLLSPGAAEALLAGLLGQASLTPHPLTDLDLRLLRLPLGAVAAEVARAVPAPGRSEVTLTRPVPPPTPDPAVVWRGRLQHGDMGGEASLVVDWAGLRAILAPPPDERRLHPEQFDELPLLVEATMAAPPLTPRELLSLEPGDVMIFGGDLESTLRANGAAVARGRLGAKGTRLAISVQQLAPVKENDCGPA